MSRQSLPVHYFLLNFPYCTKRWFCASGYFTNLPQIPHIVLRIFHRMQPCICILKRFANSLFIFLNGLFIFLNSLFFNKGMVGFSNGNFF